jgi:hypothetical protein
MRYSEMRRLLHAADILTNSPLQSLLVDAIPWMVSKISILLTGLYPQTLKYKMNRESAPPIV